MIGESNASVTGWTRSRSSFRETLDAIDTYNRAPSPESLRFIEMCLDRLPGGKKLQYVSAFRQLKMTLAMEKIMLESREQVRRLAENSFRVTSDSQEYTNSFGSAFTNALASMTASSRWLDGGAGEARAMIAYLDGGGKGQCIATGYQIPTTAAPSVRAAKEKYPDRFDYVSGKYFSGISDAELHLERGKFDLITDLNGVMYYTQTLVEDLKRYLSLLKVGGVLVFTSIQVEIDMPNATNHDPRQVPDLARWMSNITGINVTRSRRTGSYTLVKNSDDINVPHLNVITYEIRQGRNDPLRKYSCNSPLAIHPVIT